MTPWHGAEAPERGRVRAAGPRTRVVDGLSQVPHSAQGACRGTSLAVKKGRGADSAPDAASRHRPELDAGRRMGIMTTATENKNEAKARTQGTATKPAPTQAEKDAKKAAGQAAKEARAARKAAKAKDTTTKPAPAAAPALSEDQAAAILLAQTKNDEAKAAVAAAKQAKADAAATLKAAREAAKTEREAAKAAKKNLAPVWATQKDEKGNDEQVDRNKAPFEVQCACEGCTEIRFVSLSGLKEVTMCKPHARKARRARRVERLKARAKDNKAIVADAIAQGLFPEAFLTKWGLS